MERSANSPIYVDRRNLVLVGIDPEMLRDLAFFKRTFNTLILEDLKVDLVSPLDARQFEPRHDEEGDGISGVGILGASHVGIHSWPERGTLHANFEFCSQQDELDELDRHMIERFVPKTMESEQRTKLPDGRTYEGDTSYLQIQRLPSGIFIYEAQRSNIIQFSRTAHMLAQLEGSALHSVPREESLRAFELRIQKAA